MQPPENSLKVGKKYITGTQNKKNTKSGGISCLNVAGIPNFLLTNGLNNPY